MLQGATADGLLGILDAHEPVLRRYLVAHGAGEAADDLIQEMRIKIISGGVGPVQAPLSYLYRMATNLVIDNRRSALRSSERDAAWAELLDQSNDSVDQDAGPERRLAAADALRFVSERLHQLPERARRILLRHRIDGVSQRLLVQEFGVSQSTVENDLRRAYHWLDEVRREWDEATLQ
jgi:RNA polymerase sigma-70 factor (ECF subfamily)